MAKDAVFTMKLDAELRDKFMEEAERLCDRVAILDRGRLVDIGSPAALVRRHCPVVAVVVTTGDVAALARVDGKFIRNVQLCDAPLDLPESMDVVAEARGARLLTGEGELPLNDLMDALPANVAISTEIPMSLTQPRLAPLDRIQLAYEATARFLAGRS